MQKIRKPRWWATKQFENRWSVRDKEYDAVFHDVIRGKNVYTMSVEEPKGHFEPKITLYRLDFSEFCMMKLEGSLLEEEK